MFQLTENLHDSQGRMARQQLQNVSQWRGKKMFLWINLALYPWTRCKLCQSHMNIGMINKLLPL